MLLKHHIIILLKNMFMIMSVIFLNVECEWSKTCSDVITLNLVHISLKAITCVIECISTHFNRQDLCKHVCMYLFTYLNHISTLFQKHETKNTAVSSITASHFLCKISSFFFTPLHSFCCILCHQSEGHLQYLTAVPWLRLESCTAAYNHAPTVEWPMHSDWAKKLKHNCR